MDNLAVASRRVADDVVLMLCLFYSPPKNVVHSWGSMFWSLKLFPRSVEIGEHAELAPRSAMAAERGEEEGNVYFPFRSSSHF